jgi:hypothetical protein
MADRVGDGPALTIRRATLDDWPQIWLMVRDVARDGTTFAYAPDLTEEEACEDWMTPASDRVVVACGPETRVLGVANIGSPAHHLTAGPAQRCNATTSQGCWSPPAYAGLKLDNRGPHGRRAVRRRSRLPA